MTPNVNAILLRRRIAGLWVCALPLLGTACAHTTDLHAIAAEQDVHTQFVAALQSPELKKADLDEVGSTGDYWDTGTIASVDEDGHVVFLVPTRFVNGNGPDAYANRNGPASSLDDPLGKVYYLDRRGNLLMTPNPLDNRTGRMVYGSQTQRPRTRPASAPPPRPATNPQPTSSRPARSRTRSGGSRKSRN